MPCSVLNIGHYNDEGDDKDLNTDENFEDALPLCEKVLRCEEFLEDLEDCLNEMKLELERWKYRNPYADLKLTVVEELKDHALFKEWEIISKIGKRGFGIAYTAMTIISGFKVVLKKVQYLEDSEMLLKEADMMKRLDHQNIVKLIDVHKDELCNQVVLVMEFVAGDSLSYRLDLVKKFLPKEAIGIMKQLVSAFDFMHSKNIVHRDIKLDNVLCNHVWVVKVVDLGFAHVFMQGEKFYGSVGTHEYMAPEILFKNGYEGPPADVWSLGILVSKLLVGPGFYRPEIKISDELIFFKTVVGNPPPSAMKRLAYVLTKMLLENPTERPSMEEISNYMYFIDERKYPDFGSEMI